MPDAVVRYRSMVADSARWEGFPFRDGDVVISTPSKCGTTWTQMICALLVFQTPDFDLPLAEISPWLDMLTTDRDDLVAALEAQPHRRFIKTHTPLDGHLAGRLDIDVPEPRWPQLVPAARFGEMRRRADHLVPNRGDDLWRDNTEFFHRGTSGQWRERLDSADLHRYHRRIAELGDPEVADWLHRTPAVD